jgi:tRNA threonylcarbamoyl adenosine modification protein YeaZ
MRCLFLDIASHQGAIACTDDTQTVSFEPAAPGMRDDALLPVLQSALANAKWSWKDLTHIACVTGPGGFTSLRVGAACANTLADQLAIPIAGVHLSDLFRARCEEENFLWLHSTKKHEVFVRGFGIHTKLWPEPTHCTVELLAESLPKQALFAGELIPDHLAALAGCKLQNAPLLPLQKILPAFVASLPYSDSPVHPWYGRGI